MSKCSRGFICIKNATLFFLVFSLIFVCWYWHSQLASKQSKIAQEPQEAQETQGMPAYNYNTYMPANYRLAETRLSDPLIPPLKAYYSSSYEQMGTLTPANDKAQGNILPLMGKQHRNGQRWNYYTIANQFNSVKLPIMVKGKDGLNDIGVEELYSGDTVLVKGQDAVYNVLVYDNIGYQY